MRKDVKLGMVLALVAVFVAGWYYYRDKQEQQPILLGEADPVVETPAAPEVEEVAAEDRMLESTVVSSEPATEEVAEPAPTVLAGARDAVTLPEPELVASPAEPSTADSDDSGLLTARSTASVVEAHGSNEPAEEPVFDLAAVFGVEAPVNEPAETPAATGERPALAPVLVQPVAEATPGEEAAIEQYTVQPGDTLAVLAEIFYGSQRFLSLLVEANPQLENPDRLRAGSVIQIPPAPTATKAEASKDEAPPLGKGGYVVQSGDSFYRIAADKLGSGARWKEVFELNKDVVDGDPKALQPGMVLKLPKK